MSISIISPLTGTACTCNIRLKVSCSTPNYTYQLSVPCGHIAPNKSKKIQRPVRMSVADARTQKAADAITLASATKVDEQQKLGMRIKEMDAIIDGTQAAGRPKPPQRPTGTDNILISLCDLFHSTCLTKNREITITVTDGNGNEASVTLTLDRDCTCPDLGLT